MFWSKFKLLLPTLLFFPPLAVIGILGTFRAVDRSDYVMICGLAGFTFLLFISAFISTRRIIRFEMEEIEATKLANRGVLKVLLLMGLLLLVLQILDYQYWQFMRRWWGILAFYVIASLPFIWIVVRHRKFQKEAKQKIAERKTREEIA